MQIDFNRFGSTCRFLHERLPKPSPAVQPICRYWLRGICNRGTTCRFSHMHNSNNPNNSTSGPRSATSEIRFLPVYVTPIVAPLCQYACPSVQLVPLYGHRCVPQKDYGTQFDFDEWDDFELLDNAMSSITRGLASRERGSKDETKINPIKDLKSIWDDSNITSTPQRRPG